VQRVGWAHDVSVDSGLIVSLFTAGLAVIGSFIAISQAVSASKQAAHAEEQADAAILQAAEAERAQPRRRSRSPKISLGLAHELLR